MEMSDAFEYSPVTVLGASESNVNSLEVECSSALQARRTKRRATSETNTTGELSRKMKRRLVAERSDHQQAAEHLNSPQAEFKVFADESQSEDEKDCEQSSISMLYDHLDSVDDRLSVLQHLLPHGSELDKDEILKVVIDYVKALEKEIQMFDKPEEDADALISSDVLDTSGMSALQKKGLCIVPLSALAEAF